MTVVKLKEGELADCRLFFFVSQLAYETENWFYRGISLGV